MHLVSCTAYATAPSMAMPAQLQGRSAARLHPAMMAAMPNSADRRCILLTSCMVLSSASLVSQMAPKASKTLEKNLGA